MTRSMGTKLIDDQCKCVFSISPNGKIVSQEIVANRWAEKRQNKSINGPFSSFVAAAVAVVVRASE